MSKLDNVELMNEIKKILKTDINNQIKQRKNNDIVLFKIPAEIVCSVGTVPLKWQYKINILMDILITYKSSANLFCFEEGIKDFFKSEPYYWYSYISPHYNFNADRSGVYRSDLFGLVFPTSKLYTWPSIGEIKINEIDKYIT